MDDKAWLAVSIPVHPKVLVLRVGLCVDQLRSSTLIYESLFYGPDFVHRGTVKLKQKMLQ